MPAAMRGESRAEAKPRAKTPASTKTAPRARKPGAAYAPPDPDMKGVVSDHVVMATQFTDDVVPSRAEIKPPEPALTAADLLERASAMRDEIRAEDLPAGPHHQADGEKDLRPPRDGEEDGLRRGVRRVDGRHGQVDCPGGQRQ